MKLELETKFNVGDMLYRKQDINAYNNKNFRKPATSIVIEVITRTCTGGTQIFYAFRGYSPTDGHSSIVELNEIELTDKSE